MRRHAGVLAPILRVRAVVLLHHGFYDELFGDAVDANAEGRVIRPRPFDTPTVTQLLRDAPLQAAAAALLTLALTHRNTLLLPITARRGSRCIPGRPGQVLPADPRERQPRPGRTRINPGR